MMLDLILTCACKLKKVQQFWADNLCFGYWMCYNLNQH